jgi:type I restriction enzyme S subunit
MTQWQKVKVGDFLFERKEKYQPNDEKIAGLGRINKIDFSGNFHIAQKPSNTKMILICPDDLVISGINVAKGAMGVYRGDKNIKATIHYSSYTFDEGKINVDYFKRFLKSAEFVKLLQEQVKGGIKTEIKPKHILPLKINLPSIKEQKIIVKKLKDIETEESDLKQEITQQQILLKKLRQQILQEAIEGKLTQDWRVKNPNTEPASELLKRIQAEKQQLIKDKKIKAQKPLSVITEDEKLFKLPKSWVWCQVNDTQYLGFSLANLA